MLSADAADGYSLAGRTDFNVMKLAVFDLDGTLTKTFAVDGDCYLQAFTDALGVVGINANWSDYEHVTDLGVMQEVFKSRFGRDPVPNEIGRLVECFIKLLNQRYSASNGSFGEIPGAAAFLASLRQAFQWGAAIATGGWERSARFKIEKGGIGAGQLPAAFAEDGPSRDSIVRAAIARAATSYQQADFERIVLVGDAIWDLQAAKRLSLPFVGVAKGQRAGQLRSLGTSHIVENFVDGEHCLRCLEEAGVPSLEAPV